MFHDFDVEQFWEQSEYAMNEYAGAPLSRERISAVERELGYTLPSSYVELMKYQNGAIPKKTNHRTNERTSWASDHIAITGIFSIGRDKPCSLCGAYGRRFWTRSAHAEAFGGTVSHLTAHPMVTLIHIGISEIVRTCGGARLAGAGGGSIGGSCPTRSTAPSERLDIPPSDRFSRPADLLLRTFDKSERGPRKGAR